MRFLKAFGRFWWDFLVGDTPEIFVGALATMALVFALSHSSLAPFALVVLVLATVTLSLLFEKRRKSSKAR